MQKRGREFCIIPSTNRPLRTRTLETIHFHHLYQESKHRIMIGCLWCTLMKGLFWTTCDNSSIEYFVESYFTDCSSYSSSAQNRRIDKSSQLSSADDVYEQHPGQDFLQISCYFSVPFDAIGGRWIIPFNRKTISLYSTDRVIMLFHFMNVSNWENSCLCDCNPRPRISYHWSSWSVFDLKKHSSFFTPSNSILQEHTVGAF